MQPDREPAHYGRICSNCGLSQRARLFLADDDDAIHQEFSLDNYMCVCGCLADEKWLRFWIGPIDEYRRNPHGAFAAFTQRRIENSVTSRRQRIERSPRQVSAPPTPAPWPVDLPPRPQLRNSRSFAPLPMKGHPLASAYHVFFGPTTRLLCHKAR
jgi:hypothetical protein